jgi:ankyrin repeat protein
MSRRNKKPMQSRMISISSRRHAVESSAYFKKYPVHAIVKADDPIWLVEFLARHPKSKSLINIGDKKDNNNTPLHVAAIQHRALMIPYLINYGSNINQLNALGETPLLSCIDVDATSSTEDTLNALFIHGANPQLANQQGQNALLKAIQLGNSPVAMYLTNQNIDVNARDINGDTAMHYWARQPENSEFNSFGVFHSLMRLGADLQALNLQEQNVLHILTKEGNFNNLNLLSDFPFNTQQKDTYGKTPLAYYQESLLSNRQQSLPEKLFFSHQQFQALTAPPSANQPIKSATRMSLRRRPS